MESSNKPAHRLSPECSLFEALSCLLTQGLPFIPVGEDGPDQRFLSTTALVKAWQAGMPGETPVSSLELASATDLPSETPGADSLINGLPMLLWLKDRGGRFLIVNRGFAESCGQTSPQALIGKTDLDLWPQELAEAYRAEDAEVIATGRPRTRIEQIADRGTPTWFETFKAPVRSSDGQIVGTLGFACDISERMRQQAAAQHSQKQLAYVLATIGEGVWDWDLATDQVTHNPRWCQMLGLDEQNLNHPAEDFLTLVHDDDRNARATAINTCLGGAGSYRAEYRLRHADGHYLWIRDQGNVVEYGEHGQPLRMVGSIADIHAARSTALALQESQTRYQQVFDNVREVIFQTDPLGHWELLNPAWTDITGFSVDASLGRSFGDYLHPDDRASKYRAFKPLIARTRDHCSATLRLLCQDGSYRWVDIFIRALLDKNGELTGTSGTLNDVTTRVAAENYLSLTASVFRHAHESIIITDPDACILEVNDSFCALTGYTRDEVIGQNSRLLRSGRQDAQFYTQMWAELQTKGVWQGETWNLKKNGEIYAQLGNISAVRNEAGQTTHYVGLFSDITGLKESQRHLEHMAYHDALTQLPNRSLLADRMSMAIAQAERNGTLAAVAYLDLDGFKPVNDTHGHAVGDLLLVEMARRLQASTRAGDTVARLGGDEFALIYNGLEHSDECDQVFERLRASIAEPVRIDDREIRVTASIGITLCPLDGADPETLLRHADQAMYLAKKAGRNRFHLFNPERDRQLRAHRDAQSRIESALYDGELELHYQPKMDTRLNSLIGVEALIRWKHPTLGLRLPGDFLPMLSESRFEIELGNWILATAVAQLDTWRAAGFGTAMSVNIAARHLAHPDFVPHLRSVLTAHPDLDPGLLQLEVLETATLGDIKRIASIMAACNALGVSFAIDDFGIGHGAVNSLRSLPVRSIKIDRSFIHNMLDDDDDLATVQSVIGLATAFHREVIAEGVETPRHRQALLKLGCHLAQGHGIARPMSAAHMQVWMQKHPPRH
ncbi:PAS domain S-box protein [Zoogloea oleivorans]|nr:PAS domain S-box protein [Zoogloea oleivorans]